MHEAGIAHEDGGLDLVDGRGLDLDGGVAIALICVPAAAEGIIEDLAALFKLANLEARLQILY